MRPTLTHIAMHVRDLAATTAFYEEFCGLEVVHERPDKSGGDSPEAVWLAEAGKEDEFVLVLIPDGPGRDQGARDFSHLGFALESRASVDAVAERARQTGRLFWEPREEPYPVGYYCGVRDPDGTLVEFSFGQPLGPGAPAD